jgi:hypothetical protein
MKWRNGSPEPKGPPCRVGGLRRGVDEALRDRAWPCHLR